MPRVRIDRRNRGSVHRGSSIGLQPKPPMTSHHCRCPSDVDSRRTSGPGSPNTSSAYARSIPLDRSSSGRRRESSSARTSGQRPAAASAYTSSPRRPDRFVERIELRRPAQLADAVVGAAGSHQETTQPVSNGDVRRLECECGLVTPPCLLEAQLALVRHAERQLDRDRGASIVVAQRQAALFRVEPHRQLRHLRRGAAVIIANADRTRAAVVAADRRARDRSS